MPITLSLNFSTYEITFRSPFHLSNANYCPLIRKIALNIPKQSMLTPSQNISESSSQLYQPHVQLFEFHPSLLIPRRFYLLLNWLFHIVYPMVAFWAHINSTAQSTFNISFTVLGYSRRLNSFIQKSLSKHCFEVNSIWSSLFTTNGGGGKHALSKSTVTDRGKTINWQTNMAKNLIHGSTDIWIFSFYASSHCTTYSWLVASSSCVLTQKRALQTFIFSPHSFSSIMTVLKQFLCPLGRLRKQPVYPRKYGAFSQAYFLACSLRKNEK